MEIKLNLLLRRNKFKNIDIEYNVLLKSVLNKEYQEWQNKQQDILKSTERICLMNCYKIVLTVFLD